MWASSQLQINRRQRVAHLGWVRAAIGRVSQPKLAERVVAPALDRFGAENRAGVVKTKSHAFGVMTVGKRDGWEIRSHLVGLIAQAWVRRGVETLVATGQTYTEPQGKAHSPINRTTSNARVFASFLLSAQVSKGPRHSIWLEAGRSCWRRLLTAMQSSLTWIRAGKGRP